MNSAHRTSKTYKADVSQNGHGLEIIVRHEKQTTGAIEGVRVDPASGMVTARAAENFNAIVFTPLAVPMTVDDFCAGLKAERADLERLQETRPSIPPLITLEGALKAAVVSHRTGGIAGDGLAAGR
jgi:hypothetical protein